DLMAVADEMASRSLSYNGALQDLATLLHRIALAQSVPSAVPEDLPELADIQRLAAAFDPQEVQLYYQIAVHGRNEIGLAPDEYAGFTMTLLRMLAFRPGRGGAEQVPAPTTAAARPAAAPPARAAAAAAAVSHATVPTRPPAPQQAAPAAPAPQPAAPHAPAGAPPMSPARAAINAALEAARAASRGAVGGKRPSAPQPAPEASAPPAPSAPVAQPAPPAPQAFAPAPQPVRAAPPAPSAPPPWEQPGAASASARAQPQAVQNDYEDTITDDEPPSWVTEFSDDSAVAAEAAPVVTAPAPTRAPAAAPYAYQITPQPAIGWDGNWPALAGALPLRGVAQQLALQTELVECVADSASATFKLKVPVDTLRASGNSEKLAAALQERFPAIRVNVDIAIGPVWYTASAEQKAERERRLREAEATVAADPWVRTMESQFDSFIVPGSVRPPAP
ncbi:MAG TPA: DNA polymerase III subunit gamma/tau, partial [Telluria sp.]|nr:DNA polymerase III subunit gamma/tau [Telluria sp.]